jgi:hypothetical protein
LIRNHSKTGVYFFTTISSTNLYEWRAAWNVATITNTPFEEVKLEFKKNSNAQKEKENLNEGELAKWKINEGLIILKKYPLTTLYQGLAGFSKMFFETENLKNLSKFITYTNHKNTNDIYENIKKYILSSTAVLVIWRIFHLLMMYFGVLITVFYLFKGKFSHHQKNLLLLLGLIIIYFTFFSVGAEAYARFRVPIVPSLSFLGALGFATMFNLSSLEEIKSYA